MMERPAWMIKRKDADAFVAGSSRYGRSHVKFEQARIFNSHRAAANSLRYLTKGKYEIVAVEVRYRDDWNE
jgi:hypothetical protein